MNGNTLFLILFGFIVLAYVMLYVKGRHYLKEWFQTGGEAGAGSPSVGELYPTPIPVYPTAVELQDPKKGRVIMEQVTEGPFEREAVRSLDDYEYNLVFQNESDRELSTALRNKLMSQRPMDWAGLPPSSAQFQAGLRESFQNATPTVPDNAQPFQNVNGEAMTPPDTESIEMEVRKILQTYKPPTAQELANYNPEQSPEQMIQELYGVKGLIPNVKHQEGTNVWEITGVRRKDEKIVYEDEEAPAAVAPVGEAGEATIQVPPQAADIAAAADPFYNSTASQQGSRKSRWDYQAWTPGLERMFAPTESRQEWY